MTDEINIPAVHDDDLKKILSKYNLLEKFESGEVNCYICGTVMTWDNIYGIKLMDNSPKLICDSIECTEKLNKAE